MFKSFASPKNAMLKSASNFEALQATCLARFNTLYNVTKLRDSTINLSVKVIRIHNINAMSL